MIIKRRSFLASLPLAGAALTGASCGGRRSAPATTASLAVLPTIVVPSKFAWPDASNTGYSGALTEYTGPTSITTNDTTIENKHITSALDIYATGFTMRNCLMDGFTGYWAVNGRDNPITVEHCTIVGPGTNDGGNGTYGIYASGTFTRNNISQFMHPIHLQDKASTITGNYIHDLQSYGPAGPHYDGIYIGGGQDTVIFQDNTVYGRPTASIYLTTDFGSINNVMIHHNLALCDARDPPGYTCYATVVGTSYTITNVSFTDNVIQKGAFGYFDIVGCMPTISGNTDYVTGRPVS